MGRQNLHDRLASGDDAARCMVVGADHCAIDGRANNRAFQNFRGLTDLLAHAIKIGFGGLKRIKCRLFVGVDGNDLFLLELGYFRLALVHFAGQPCDVAHSIGDGTFQCKHIGLSDNTILRKPLFGIAFLGQKRELAIKGLLLTIISRIAKLERPDVLSIRFNCSSSFTCLLWNTTFWLWMMALMSGSLASFMTISGILKVFALSLGAQTGDDCFEAQTAQLQHAFIGECSGFVEGQEYIAFLDSFTFVHQHFFDDPTFEVLDNLIVAGRDKTSLSDDRRG